MVTTSAQQSDSAPWSTDEKEPARLVWYNLDAPRRPQPLMTPASPRRAHSTESSQRLQDLQIDLLVVATDGHNQPDAGLGQSSHSAQQLTYSSTHSPIP
jgi:hypothetical protein